MKAKEAFVVKPFQTVYVDVGQWFSNFLGQSYDKQKQKNILIAFDVVIYLLNTFFYKIKPSIYTC